MNATDLAKALPLESASLVDRLTEAIHVGILNGEHPVGSHLRQEAIAAQFGVSRTPVREALRRLEAAEVIELVANHGAVVRGPTPRAIREAYMVRAELEGLAVELATPRMTPDDLLELRLADQRFSAAVREIAAKDPADPEAAGRAMSAAWSDANDRFHEVIQRASGNERLRRTISDLHRLFPRSLTWSALSGRPELLAANLEEHRRIREALERRDTATARLLMSYHVHRAGELIAQSWEASAPAEA